MELQLRTAGRQEAHIEMESAGPILEEDLALLALPRNSKPPAILRLRDRHHALARLLAQGYSERDAAIISGYDISRVSILKNDPTFQELVSHYRERVEDKFDLFASKLATIANEAAAELIERLEDEETAGEMTVQQLAALVELGADRTGYGKQTRNESLNINANLATDLDAARKRVAERRNSVEKEAKVIDARPSD